MRSVLASLRRRKLTVSIYSKCFRSYSKDSNPTQTSPSTKLSGRLSVTTTCRENPPSSSHHSVWNVRRDDYQASYPLRSTNFCGRHMFSTSWSGADLAQRILASSTAKDIAEITSSLADVNPSVRMQLDNALYVMVI
jgi:hypothetical protein